MNPVLCLWVSLGARTSPTWDNDPSHPSISSPDSCFLLKLNNYWRLKFAGRREIRNAGFDVWGVEYSCGGAAGDSG